MRFIILLLLLTTGFIATAQETSLQEDAKQLTLLTFDTSQMKRMKYVIATSVIEEDVEAFKKEFDVAINTFVAEGAKYYIANYSHEEIKELIRFYESPVGKKMAKDQRKLLEGSFPFGNEWDMQLHELKKSMKNKKE